MYAISQVSVLIILIVLGYGCAKFKIAGPSAAGCFSIFIINVSLPCITLVSFQRPFSAELLGEGGAAVAASALMYGIAFLAAMIFPRLLGIKGPERGVHRYAIMFSNCGFMGFPMIEALLGEEYLFHACAFNIFFNLLAYSLGAWLIAREGTRRMPVSWKIFVNPTVIATFIGMLLFLFSVSLPAPIYKSLKMAGDTTSPLAMMVIGINLAQAKAGQVWGRRQLYITAFIRLAVLPFLVALGCRLLGFHGPVLILVIILAAMPAASATSILASVYNVAPEESSSLVFLSTLFSMATIPLIMFIINTLSI
jgi:predicted permease